MSAQNGGFNTVLNHLFAQMDRLEGCAKDDPEALRAEVERGKSLVGLANTVVGVSQEIRAANAMQMKLAGNGAFKRMGDGGGK